MNLKFQENLKNIVDCPLGNEKGSKKLYRCVENPMTSTSFEPHAVLYKPRFQNTCIAWGLSLFSDFKSAHCMLKSLSANKRQKIKLKSVAFALISDEDGIKYCMTNKKHYTYFPDENINFISKFAIINENE